MLDFHNYNLNSYVSGCLHSLSLQTTIFIRNAFYEQSELSVDLLYEFFDEFFDELEEPFDEFFEELEVFFDEFFDELLLYAFFPASL